MPGRGFAEGQHSLTEPNHMVDFPDSAAVPSVPPPPEFGMVMDAPPPRDPALVTAMTTGVIEHPQPKKSPWVAAVIGFALVAGVVGFVLGGLGDDEPADADPPAVAAATPEVPPASKAEATPPGDEVAVVAPADEGPCSKGMVRIEGGKFFMGTDRDVPTLAPAHPAHQVEVGTYCIDVHEVTVDEYRECSERGECKRAHRTSEWPRPEGQDEEEWKASLEPYHALCNEQYEDHGDHPINCVSWEQAQRYCEWQGGRLPTEAEWEFAARGSDGRVYPWGDQDPGPERMNGCGAECRTWRAARGLSKTPSVLYDASDKYPGTAPVGSFPAGRTQWGLDDIAGNVFEWTADPFAPYPGAAATEDSKADRRVIRGGAFNSFLAEHADPALRFPQAQSAHTHGIGFRCAAAVRSQ